MKYNFCYIFDNLDRLYKIVGDYEKDIVDEIIGDIDDALFSLKHDLDQKEHEIELLREELFELKYRY